MTELVLVKTNSKKKLLSLKGLIEDVLKENFSSLFPQTYEYMLSFIDEDAIKEDIKLGGFLYYFIQDNGKNTGYLRYKIGKTQIYISSIYILKEFQNKGYGKFALEKIKEHNMKIVLYPPKDFNNDEFFIKEGFKKIKPTVLYLGSNHKINCTVMEYNP